MQVLASIRCMKTSTTAPRFKHLKVRMASVAAIAGCMLTSSEVAFAQEAIKIPMTADRWEAKDNVEFVQEDAYPLGVMKVNKGVAVLKDLGFKDGTIEFDVVPNGPMGAGIGFRRRDSDTYEDFYLRPRPNCEAAPDCIQYAPQTHGVLLWDVFPQYQGPAPLKDGEVNHVKLVVSGRRMNIFINPSNGGGDKTPVLAIGRLEGDALEGGLLMQGPGTFANLTVVPGAVEGLAPEPASDPTEGDNRFMRNWLVSSSASLPDGKDPAYAEMPAAAEAWMPLKAERSGLVNLSRQMGLPTGRKVRAVAWLKANIESEKSQSKHVSIGWSREIWIFVNGKLVYADKNLYQPPAARKKPDGRLSLENGSFDLPMQKGKNEIAVALANDFYGWGLEMRLDEMKGVQIDDGKNPLTARR
jgi:hypothetical protein